jgi:hypothetical protein
MCKHDSDRAGECGGRSQMEELSGPDLLAYLIWDIGKAISNRSSEYKHYSCIEYNYNNTNFYYIEY